MLRRICPIFFLILFFVFPSKALAVTININQYPSSISQDPFNVNFTISGASEGQNYVRVDLYKDGTSNYFGDTYNGKDWYGSSDGKEYFPIMIDSSKAASGNIQARVGSPSLSEFPGSGPYKLRIRRYTASGTAASSDQENPVDIAINFSLPTPTFTPSPSPRPTPTLKPVLALSKSQSPTPMKAVPTGAVILKDTPSFSAKESGESGSSEAFPTSILGEATESSQPTNIKKNDIKKSAQVLGQSHSNIPFILVISGIIFGACAILAYLIYKRKSNDET